ncbi:uncharacterized protein LOC116307396 [Actinia tenebrosa]|uniref:Uncharacterized protein LOC116307396 n=1 Tax=Actinia tenebrosa TaxID=6105 RepID=A0A6P8J1V3_ACTTE|nr:uncharacterized protein LOC116307396 [Actinia tenebrosa]
MAIWRPFKVKGQRCTMNIVTALLATTNPGVVFDNGAFGLASPLPFTDLLEISSQDKEEREGDGWVGWKQGSYGQPFFDQVAELESILTNLDDSDSLKTPGCCLNLLNEKTEFIQEVPAFISNLKESPLILPESSFEDLDLPSSTDILESPDEDVESIDTGSSTSDKVAGLESLDPFASAKEARPRKQGKSRSSPPMDSFMKTLDKRIRNNQASKKFRKVRKGKQRALFDKVQELANENYELKVQMEKLVQEIDQLKANIPEDIQLLV